MICNVSLKIFIGIRTSSKNIFADVIKRLPHEITKNDPLTPCPQYVSNPSLLIGANTP